MDVFNKLYQYWLQIKTCLRRNDRECWNDNKGFGNDANQKSIYQVIFAWDLYDNSARFRIIIIIATFALCFIGLAYRLIIVTNSNHVRSNEYSAKTNFRKEIVDRYGKVLTISVPSSSLFAYPAKITDPRQSLNKLSKIIPNLNIEKLLLELSSNKNFVWIARDLSPAIQTEITNLGLPGFGFEREQKRVYLFGRVLSHIIGYVGRDLIGLAGLEKKYDQFLRNVDQVNGANNANAALELSVDVRLQTILSEELESTIQQFNAIGGAAIVANPHNGEILAMVSKPDFDPHHPQKATNAQLFNTASHGIYEIGSGFKSVTIAIGLDTEAITVHDAYNISYMRVGRFEVKDYHPRSGWHSVAEIFLHSSNIGTSQIILEIGKNNFKKYLKNLGLLEQLTIELPERGTPLFPADSRWTDLGLVTMSYGYGISISPLHFVQAMLPVVNGGNLYPLTLIKKQNDQLVGKRVFSEETSRQMRKLLRLVVKEGTGKRADVKGYLVGGKTGTANKSVAGRYAQNSRISSFFGVLPASDPQYVIYVMLDDPKGNKQTSGHTTAGWNAAPLVNKIFERMVALYGLSAIDEESSEIQNILNIDYKIDHEI